MGKLKKISGGKHFPSVGSVGLWNADGLVLVFRVNEIRRCCVNAIKHQS